VPFTYESGAAIRKGDRVLFHGEPAEIEFLAEALTGDPAMDWYIEKLGVGVMIIEPKHYGRVFLHETDTAEDLMFISRAENEAHT
jgi:hypothetical protein